MPTVFDVLLVDDDELVRSTLSSVLEMEGWTVCGASGAEEALSMAHPRERCGLMVTDIDLGDTQNGFDLAARLRGLNPNMPVVYVSGRPWLFDNRVLAPDERSLAKPFRAEELTRMVRELMPARY